MTETRSREPVGVVAFFEFIQSVSQSVSQPASQPADRPTDQSINQSGPVSQMDCFAAKSFISITGKENL